jgi:hypothetical protein
MDTYVGGFSICDALSCLLTCGLILRGRQSHSAAEGGRISTDFRKRFEDSQDKERKLAEALARGEVKRTKQPKDINNYLSQDAKQKSIYGPNDGFDQENENGFEFQNRGKCYQFCCIVFCCMDPGRMGG